MINLAFEQRIAEKYHSQSQKIRVLTENWVDNHIFCPNCGQQKIDRFNSNKPVADFFCSNCKEEYELKSKKDSVSLKIVDGAYRTMIERLSGSNNPNFFLLNYDFNKFEVIDFLVIPKHFFVPDIIEKRKPLSETARRAGWVGCNILLNNIPQSGKIFFVKNREINPKKKIISEWKKTLFLRREKEINAKGWLLNIMNCIEQFRGKDFLLDEVYVFESELSKRYPDNKHIKDKIRQQLQILRDNGYLEFIKRGRYRLV